MREIKFDFVARNIHFDEIHHNVYTLDQIWDGREILTWLKSDNCEMIACRLYTGLKDKNGVEIYEGDVVQEYDVQQKTEVIGVYQMVYYKNGFYLDDGMHSNWDAENIEVIGNVYDNPELLK